MCAALCADNVGYRGDCVRPADRRAAWLRSAWAPISDLANWNLLSPERSLPGTCRGDRTAAPGASVCLGKMCARAVPVGLFYLVMTSLAAFCSCLRNFGLVSSTRKPTRLVRALDRGVGRSKLYATRAEKSSARFAKRLP